MKEIYFRRYGKQIIESDGTSGYDEGDKIIIEGKTFYREGNLSPQTDGMPVIPKKEAAISDNFLVIHIKLMISSLASFQISSGHFSRNLAFRAVTSSIFA